MWQYQKNKWVSLVCIKCISLQMNELHFITLHAGKRSLLWITLSNKFNYRNKVQLWGWANARVAWIVHLYCPKHLSITDLHLNEKKKIKTTCLLSSSSNWWSLTSWWFLKDLLQIGHSFLLSNQFCIQCVQ